VEKQKYKQQNEFREYEVKITEVTYMASRSTKIQPTTCTVLERLLETGKSCKAKDHLYFLNCSFFNTHFLYICFLSLLKIKYWHSEVSAVAQSTYFYVCVFCLTELDTLLLCYQTSI